MKKMLCLQDVSGVSEVDLAERLRIITGWKACRTEECERRFEIDGEEAVLRCRETELQPPVKNSELRLIAKEGIVIMAAKLLPLREMTVVYTSKELTKLSTVVEKLCCRMSLIIAEPVILGSCLPIKMAVCRRWPFAIFLGRFMWSVKPGSNFCSSRKKRFL